MSLASATIRPPSAFASSSRSLPPSWTRCSGRARGGPSALLLSTCNRCELYWAGPHDYESWFRDLARARGVTLTGELMRSDGAEAVRHLFTVTAGLDSQILGETEILGQVRRAFDAARAAGTTTRDMDAIFSAALTAGRRVRRETMLGRHPASVSSAAVELAASAWGGTIGDRPVVVLGAGEAAEGVLRALQLQGASRVALVNRHPARAAMLASAWGAAPHGWEALPALLERAALLVVATAASRPVVSAGELAAAVAGRSDGDFSPWIYRYRGTCSPRPARSRGSASSISTISSGSAVRRPARRLLRSRRRAGARRRDRAARPAVARPPGSAAARRAAPAGRAGGRAGGGVGARPARAAVGTGAAGGAGDGGPAGAAGAVSGEPVASGGCSASQGDSLRDPPQSRAPPTAAAAPRDSRSADTAGSRSPGSGSGSACCTAVPTRGARARCPPARR